MATRDYDLSGMFMQLSPGTPTPPPPPGETWGIRELNEKKEEKAPTLKGRIFSLSPD